MQTTKLRIGTVTACYNAGKYFQDCYNGIMSQTYRPDFMAIVDDGSKDDSYNEIKKVLGVELKLMSFNSERGPIFYETGSIEGIRVFLIKHPKNMGQSAARNTALKFLMNLTDVIAIADCDDIYYPTKIEKSILKMQEYPHVALVYSDYETVNEANGGKTREYKEPFSYQRLFDECIVSNNSVIATNILQTVGLYDETLVGGEDYDLWLRIAEVGAVYHIPEALYMYRLTGNNVTVITPKEKFAEAVRRVHMKAIGRRNGNNVN